MSKAVDFSCSVILILTVYYAAADNFTEKYLVTGYPHLFQSRQHRLLSFDTDDDGDIDVS